jgi:aminoglycoside 6'-N-acetyltransferase I
VETVIVRNVGPQDRAEWLRMRRTLWDDCPDEQQVREMDEIEVSDTEAVFVAERTGGGLCGFVETSIRSWAIGCEARSVGYVEGWYVDPDMRRREVGRALVEAAEAWAQSRGCRQMASDAELWNEVSHQAHGAIGYRETARLVLFKKDLNSGRQHPTEVVAKGAPGGPGPAAKPPAGAR